MATVTVRQCKDKRGGFVAIFSGWGVRDDAHGRTIGAAIDGVFSGDTIPDCAQDYKRVVVAKFAEWTDREWVQTGSLPYAADLFPVSQC